VTVDGERLSAALDRISRLPRDPTDLSTVLGEAIEQGCGVFTVAGMGLMLVDGGQVLRYVAASDLPVRALEEAQETTGHGPCVDSLVDGQTVASGDVQADDRWPTLGSLLRTSSVHAVLGVPITLAGNCVGTLNAYDDQAHDWDDSEIAAIEQVAAAIAHLLMIAVIGHQQGRLAEQLQYALDHRIFIERAVGVVMATHQLGAVDAFDHLRRQARSQQQTVANIADEVLASHEHQVGDAGP
jgi:GAF domain-containing protein